MLLASAAACSKKSGDAPAPVPPTVTNFKLVAATLTDAPVQAITYGVAVQPALQLRFSAPLNRASVAAVTLSNGAANVPLTTSFAAGDSVLVAQPSQPLSFLAAYTFAISTSLKSKNGGQLSSASAIAFHTGIDSASKFPPLSDSALLDLVQQQTFRYFWDFGHPVSGLARERNTSGDVVTSGGSGFGIMAMIAAVHRGFITRAAALQRLQTITGFLKTHAQTFHGAFSHWLDGSSGAVVPFSPNDNGADLVETSYLMQGLLTARQFFNGGAADEIALRADINRLWQAVEWDWFRKGGENVLYWHWSPDKEWVLNVPIRGWNETLITYALAAASPTHGIPATVYHEGWAQNGALRNGQSFYGVVLPLGPDGGGPLFFEHYSFLGINPNGLKDQYADYGAQTTAHTTINYNYCLTNPKGFWGYSAQCWGLTASDDPAGYAAHAPTNDDGVISPTAAVSSMPYLPQQSLAALRFFYATLGDKVWGEYGFKDAFSLQQLWFADSYLAIDQGPIIVMIENYRSQLLWNLFMSAPEVKSGLRSLGFSSPHL